MTFRAFISVDLNGNDIIQRFSAELKALGRGLKVVDVAIMHITLKFLGDTDESSIPGIVNAMEVAAKNVPPFDVHLKGAGAFGSGSNLRTVWIGIQDSGYLAQMARSLDEQLAELGFKRENRPFSAHLTVARAKDNCDSQKVREVIGRSKDVDFGTQKATLIKLKKSVLRPEGPTYNTVQEVPIEPI